MVVIEARSRWCPIVSREHITAKLVPRGDPISGERYAKRVWARRTRDVMDRHFPVLPNGNRRLAEHFENLAETLATFVTLASIQLALRRLARA